MKRAMALLGLALLLGGCGESGKPSAEVAAPPSKPAPHEAKAIITAYLGQCGWKDVELAQLTDTEVPKESKAHGEVWAFTFTAHYTNVIGERQTSENWVAVVGRFDGSPCVRVCFDRSKRLVGGHNGGESTETANLTPAPPAESYPEIVAPKP